SAATTTNGSSPTAADVQSVLNAIPALTGNVLVTGNTGGPYTVEYLNNLTGKDAVQLTVPVTTGGTTANVTTLNGPGPTAAQVQANLFTISGLNGNVSVAGADG